MTVPARTFHWDFFGPRAAGTAAHFHKHLLEFLERNACPPMPSGLEELGPAHHAVFCTPPEELAESIQRALRPKRVS
jgi:hypothetical protein